jgi:hypothetical protein
MSGRLKILDVMSVTSYSNMTKVFLERVKNQFYEKKIVRRYNENKKSMNGLTLKSIYSW